MPHKDTILVVDDNPDELRFLVDTLDAEGMTVLIARSGEATLDLLSEVQPDLVLMDAVMPGLSGIETTRAIKRAPKTAHIPVIFLTGLNDPEHVVTALGTGGVDYVRKPIVIEELLARIRVRLREAGQQGAAETVLRHGEITLDLRARRITVDGATLDLSAREFGLAEQFLRHPDQVLSPSSCSAESGGSTSTRVRTSSTSTCATCAPRSAPTASRRCGAWAIDWPPRADAAEALNRRSRPRRDCRPTPGCRPRPGSPRVRGRPVAAQVPVPARPRVPNWGSGWGLPSERPSGSHPRSLRHRRRP